ncbi:MAG: hypothetical protein JMDDDDMK_04088 [Acidobacteria bacterium]|nr:hypothetical protein [Acidobacteriota bacterium]
MPTVVGMNIATAELQTVKAQSVIVTDELLTVELADGRTLSVPLSWYPRLWHGRLEERQNWRLIGQGEGIHWPDLDEDVSVQNLLLGRPSSEGPASLRQWLTARSAKQQG